MMDESSSLIGFGLANLSLDPGRGDDDEPEQSKPSDSPNAPLDVCIDVDAELSLELGKLIRVVNDIKHRTALDNEFAGAGHFNIINSHPVATGSFFQVRKLDGVRSSQPMVAKYPRLRPIKEGYRITKSSLQSIKLEIEALCHEPLRRHANIVDIRGLGWARLSALHDHVVPVLFLDFATHGTMRHYLSDNETTPAERLRLGRHVGQGLKALHASGIVHGDLKLENVLIFDKGDGTVIAKLADFGSTVQLTEQGFQQRGGTRPWNAPEWQQSIEPVHQHLVDVYSFGLLVWTLCIDGETPFPSLTPEEIDLRKIQNLVVRQAIQSVTDYYEFYRCFAPPKTKADQLDLYMVAVVCPRNVFEQTLLLQPTWRSLDRALERMDPEAYYGAPTEKPQKRDPRGLLFHDKGRNAYMMLADAPQIVRRVLISDFIKRTEDTTLSTSELGELSLQIALSYLDGFTGCPDTGKALDWLVRSAELECRAARGINYRIFSAVGLVRLRSDEGLAARIKRWLIESAAAGDRIALEDLREVDYEQYLEAVEASKQKFYLSSMDPGEGRITGDLVRTLLDPSTQIMVPSYLLGGLAELRVNRKLNTILHCGSAYGVDLNHFKALIDERSPQLDVQDEDGNTALLLAMRSGYYHHAKLLLDRGADCRIGNALGETPLHWMIQVNDPQHVKDLVDAIAPERLDFEKAATRKDLDHSKMYIQTHSDGTPLHWAVYEGREDVVKCFLEHGANPTYPYKNASPLDYSVQLNMWKLVKLLTRYAEKPIASKIIGNRQNPAWSSKSKHLIAENWINFAMFGFPRHQYIIQHGVLYSDAFRKTLVELRRAGLAERNLKKQIAYSLQRQDADLTEALLSFESFKLLAPPTHVLVELFINEASYIAPTAAELLLQEISKGTEIADLSLLQTAIIPYACSMYASPKVTGMILEIASVSVDEPRDHDGYTPFLAAVRAGNFDVATALIRRGADPDVKVPAGNSTSDQPYMVNILHNLLIVADDLTIAAVQYLLDPPHGITVRKPSFVVCKARGLTALHVAANWGNKTLLDYLLVHFHKQADLNAAQTPDGYTALHLAAHHGYLEVARELVHAGANVNAESRRSKHTPMDWCHDIEKINTNLARISTFWEDLWIGRLRISEYLAEQGGIMRRKPSMPIARLFVEHACQDNRPRLFDEAWKRVPRELKTQDQLDRLLLQTCLDGNSEVASRLIEAGADVNCRWMEDERWAGHTALHKVAALGDDRTALLLVRSGADLNIRDENGRTSAIYAFAKQHHGMVSYLLSQGAPDNFPDKLEVPLVATMVDQRTGEEWEEEIFGTAWGLKWTEEKDGSSETRTSLWMEEVRPATQSGIIAARMANRSQSQKEPSPWSRGRRGEGFHEAWSRILNRRRRASATDDETPLDNPNANLYADTGSHGSVDSSTHLHDAKERESGWSGGDEDQSD